MNSQNLLHINSNSLSNFYSISEYQRVYINNLIGEKLKNGIAKNSKINYVNLQYDAIEDIFSVLEEHYNFYNTNTTDGYIIEDEFIIEILLQYESKNSKGFLVNILSKDLKSCGIYFDKFKTVLSEFIIDKNFISYEVLQYKSGDDYSAVVYREEPDVNFNPLAMPFVDDIDDYIQKYLNSQAPLLILHGQPGTGKTTFVKYILSQMQHKKSTSLNVVYSFDETMFYSSTFFNKMIYDNFDILVLEDINQVLYKNLEDPSTISLLSKFLSVLDGLISKGKKVIITTNIESKTQIKPALIRPGRCFDVLQFRNIEGVEIDNLCDSCAKDLDLQIESINVSEFYAKCNNEQNNTIIKNSVGF